MRGERKPEEAEGPEAIGKMRELVSAVKNLGGERETKMLVQAIRDLKKKRNKGANASSSFIVILV